MTYVNRHLKALRRRLDYLTELLAEDPEYATSPSSSYDRSEIAALRWALSQLERKP